MFQAATLRGCIEQQAVEATTTVEVALGHQIRRTQRNLMAVKRRLSALQGEIQHLRNLKVTVEAALHDTRQPLKSTVTRPGTADTTQALDREANTAASFSSSLQTAWNDIVRTLQQLLDMESMLRQQIQWLTSAILRDNECITSAPCRPSKRHQQQPGNPTGTGVTTPFAAPHGDGKTPTSMMMGGGKGKEVPCCPIPQLPTASSSSRGTSHKTASSASAKSSASGKATSSQAGSKVVRPGTAKATTSATAAPTRTPSPRRPSSSASSRPRSAATSSSSASRGPTAAVAGGGGIGNGSRASSSSTASLVSSRRSAATKSSVGDGLGLELDPLLWEQEVNAAYTAAQALMSASTQLRLQIGQDIYKGNQRCGNARKAVFDSVGDSISMKMESRQSLLNAATRMELQLHKLKKQWEGTAESAEALSKPLGVAAERQFLRAHIPDSVGGALEHEREVLREGRQQLKRKCKVVLTDLLKTEKDRAELIHKAAGMQNVIQLERGYLATDNPMSTGTGVAPRPPKVTGKKVFNRGKSTTPSAPFA